VRPERVVDRFECALVEQLREQPTTPRHETWMWRCC
jgi:hypothetical protein